MAKVSFSLLISLFLYLVLFAHPTTSAICPITICPNSQPAKDDDDCRLVRPTSRCWQMKEVNFVNDLISPLSSISAQIKTQLPQTEGANMIAALTTCAKIFSDALKTLMSSRDKLHGGGKVDWITLAMGLYTDISACHKAISGVEKPKTNVDFSGSGDVLDVLRKVINGS